MIKKKIYKDKDTQTQTKTNMMCFQDPMHAIFLKSRRFSDIKYDISSKKGFYTKLLLQSQIFTCLLIA